MRNAIRPISALPGQRNDAVFRREELHGDRSRGIVALGMAGLLGLLNSAACGSSSSTNEDASLADTSTDRLPGKDSGGVPDVSAPVGLDATVDTTASASVDAPIDASADTTVDSPVDARVDAPISAPVDASMDTPMNASVDAQVDAFVGPPVDASFCTLADGGMSGTTCAQGQVCNDGICQRACGVGQTACADDVCHDLMNENANCGWCGSECSLDKQCIGGDCTCIVPGMCPS